MSPGALLFDMDGTITEPMLDFDLIKAEMGIGDSPILEAMAAMVPGRRAICEAILARHELAAAHGSALNAGCRALLRWVEQQRMRTALITRNSMPNVRIVVEKHSLAFDTLVSREDSIPKPHPQPLLLACKRLGIAPTDAWMIGDGRYDIEAGLAADIRTVWISHGRQRHFAAEPSHCVRDLVELHAFLANL